MQKANYQKSIVILGPKAVGKTLISTNLSKETGLPVLSSDLLTNFIAAKLSGLPTEKIEFPLESKINLKELQPLIYRMAKIKQDNSLSEKAQRVGLQYWKIRLLEEALSQIDFPVILDLGADIGVIYNLSQQEKKEIENEFFLSHEFISSRQEDFLKRFDFICFIKPGKDYLSGRTDRAADRENELYRENKNSYSKFATHEISSENLLKTSGAPSVQKNGSEKNSGQVTVNNSTLDNLTKEIITLKQNEKSSGLE